MTRRNDLTPLQAAGIPVDTAQFECGCWGRHAPPTIDPDGTIVFYIGVGYRSSRHLHGQNMYVLEVAPETCQALVEMRKFGDLYGAGLWHYLIGVDACGTYVKQVSSRVETIQEAQDSLAPVEVKRAHARGLQVRQYGDWFFVPASASWRPRSEPRRSYTLDEGCMVEEAFVGKTVLYVRGAIFHWRLPPLHLDNWHKARRDKSVRNGYLARVSPDEERRTRVSTLQGRAMALGMALESLQEPMVSGLPEVLRGLRGLMNQTQWSNVCLDCRYVWHSPDEPARCPRCHSRNVTGTGRQVEEPSVACTAHPDEGTICTLGRELHQACLGAWGGSPWTRPPESVHQVIEGLRRLAYQEPVRGICLACQHIWESPTRPQTCPFCGEERITERTITG